MSGPFVDRQDVERTILAAKIRRAEYWRDKSARSAKAARRLGWLVFLIATGFVILGMTQASQIARW
jgi:hypothetical protein